MNDREDCTSAHTAFPRHPGKGVRRKSPASVCKGCLPWRVSHPEPSCSHQSAHWRQVSRCLEICYSWRWMRIQHSSWWGATDAPEMLRPCTVLFKDTQSTWLMLRSNGERRWWLLSQKLPTLGKRNPYIMSLCFQIRENNWKHCLNLQNILLVDLTLIWVLKSFYALYAWVSVCVPIHEYIWVHMHMCRHLGDS